MEYYDGGCVRFGKNGPHYIKGKGCISLTNELRCDNAYWVDACLLIPFSIHNSLSSLKINSPPLSDLKHSTYL